MLKLIDAEKAKLFGLPPTDIDETKYPKADVEAAVAAGAFMYKTSGTTTKAKTQVANVDLAKEIQNG